MLLPSFAIAAELQADPSQAVALSVAILDRALPPIYFQHPVVVASAEAGEARSAFRTVIRRRRSAFDAILGMFVQGIMSQTCHLMASLRKTEMCGCGCRGVCFMLPLYEAFARDFESMIRGTGAQKRHDGQPFGSGDYGLTEMIRRSLGFKAICLLIKAD